MYRPTDHAPPRTPRSKTSSTSLLSVFKNLTGARPKALLSSPSTTATTLPTLSDHPPPLEKPAQSPPPPLGHGIHLRLASPAPGGPDQLRPLLDQLHDGNDLSVRAKAASQVANLLKSYPVDNVMDIWTTAKDLVEDDESPETHAAGYGLLYACVKHKTLTPHERGFFFEAIPRQENPNTFGLRFKVLRAITEDARYLDSLENMIIPLLVRLLKQCFDGAVVSRKRAKQQATDSDDSSNLQRGSNSQLKQVFDFVADAIKFNSKLCTREDLKSLVDELLLIACSTQDEDDTARSIQTIDSLITYSQLHPENLQAYVEVIAGAYVQGLKMKEQAWKAIYHLMRSHHSPATHDALLGILKGTSSFASKPAHHAVIPMKGAVQIYTRIVTSPDSDEPLPQTSISKLISACRKSLIIATLRLDKDILALMLELINNLDTTAFILDEKRWTNFTEIVEQCAKRLPAEARPSQLRRPISQANGRLSSTTKDADALAERDKEISFQRLQQIADSLIARSADMEFDHRSRVMGLFMRVVGQLNDSTTTVLIEFYALEVLLSPSTAEWQSGSDQLLKAVLYDGHRTSSVRKSALKTLHDAYNTAEALGKDNVDDLLLAILKRVSDERDIAVLEELSYIAAGIASWTKSQKVFDQIVEILQETLANSSSSTPAATPTSAHTDSSPQSWNLTAMPETTSLFVARALVVVFLRCINRSSWKTEKIYRVVLSIAQSEQSPSDARIVCLKLLFRLRADTNHSVFVVSSTDCQDLAEALCRTEKTAAPHNYDSPTVRPTHPDDSIARRPTHTPGNSSATLPRGPSVMSRPYSNAGRISKPTPPLWLYPGPKGLPEEPQLAASRLIYSYLDVNKTVDLSESRTRIALDLGAWLEFLLNVLQQPGLEWEVYSYILVHLGAQLTNHALFVNCVPQMRMLRSIVCQQLSNKSFHEPPAFTSLKKDDVALCLYHILTMLLGYREHYSKNEEDDMVKMFVLGIGSWERTADTCIHALSICCHETPASVTKSVSEILSRMSQIITRGQAAVHILEFLASLARLPDLYRNFRDDEFRPVFAICFNYLRFVRDRKRSASDPRRSHSQLRLFKSGRESPSMTDQDKPAPSLADDLPQYVDTLTYHVMTFWFISLRIQDRAKHIPWIEQNLTPEPDAEGKVVLDEQAQVLIDLMERISYTDRDETAANPSFATENDGMVVQKSWLVGMSILTIETAGRTGVSQIVRRRPSSTKYTYYRPNLVKLSRHQVPINTGYAAEAYYQSDYVGIMPEDVLQEFYAPQNLGNALTLAERPVLLEDNDMTKRGISAFDRISPLDGHKAGIIYIGENHTTERDILQNVMGPADYTAFLNKIGTLTELKGAKFNTQGLDREMDMDGKFTFAWRDRVSELVFHVTTMMPTNIENDPHCTAKKRHIGNDFVNIVFNNSGHPFRFDTFPSDFNYVYIVITPEARASFVETRLSAADYISTNSSVAGEGGQRRTGDEDPWDHLFYKVTVMTRPDIPRISPAADTKIVSGASLASFVRLLTLNASVFCHVWASRQSSGGEHVSSWCSRLREIKKLRERHVNTEMPPPSAPSQQPWASPTIVPKQAPIGRTTSGTGLSHLNLSMTSNGTTQSVRDSGGIFGSSMRDTTRNSGESAFFRRQSVANFTLEGSTAITPAVEPSAFNLNTNVNRHSTLSRGSAATDMERSSSQGSAATESPKLSSVLHDKTTHWELGVTTDCSWNSTRANVFPMGRRGGRNGRDNKRKTVWFSTAEKRASQVKNDIPRPARLHGLLRRPRPQRTPSQTPCVPITTTPPALFPLFKHIAQRPPRSLTNRPRPREQTFLADGCPNCEEFLNLRGSADAINDCTSPVFEGMIVLADPAQSWVAKWQRLTEYQPGVYATKVVGALPEDVVQSIEDAGVKYIPRDGTAADGEEGG
ncbi:hypothetical protein FH972_024913 [Carpinus fangiana]|uniref:Rap-GAP domain-containing protein n=1 Tax=Carpinus fangiana TaxID=176857 RepID=A0A5N6KZV8_9ROSI|nr:hypothetical protein FH972_024913 [Carpinus fangiana]